MKKIGFSALLLAIFTFGTFTAMAVPAPGGNCPFRSCVAPQNEDLGNCLRKPYNGGTFSCEVDLDSTGQLCYKSCITP